MCYRLVRFVEFLQCYAVSLLHGSEFVITSMYEHLWDCVAYTLTVLYLAHCTTF